ncbi:MAG: hypothetical protein ABI091_28390 [Ferruginibacter sp.]
MMDLFTNYKFVINYNNEELKVYRKLIANQSVYIVFFTDGKKPLFLNRAMAPDYSMFWTSVPEGRQAEAEEIGPLIEEQL